VKDSCNTAQYVSVTVKDSCNTAQSVSVTVKDSCNTAQSVSVSMKDSCNTAQSISMVNRLVLEAIHLKSHNRHNTQIYNTCANCTQTVFQCALIIIFDS
jgi:hypothetical protein